MKVLLKDPGKSVRETNITGHSSVPRLCSELAISKWLFHEHLQLPYEPELQPFCKEEQTDTQSVSNLPRITKPVTNEPECKPFCLIQSHQLIPRE